MCATLEDDLDGVHSSWLQTAPTLAVLNVREMTEQVEITLSLSYLSSMSTVLRDWHTDACGRATPASWSSLTACENS